MKRNHDLWRRIATILGNGGEGILTTCSVDGMPHATWMTAVIHYQLKEVFAVTSPETQKIANIQANPQAEWMFSTPSFETVIYLSGSTEVVKDESESRRYWHDIPRKSKGFYRQYCDLDDFRKFAIIRTSVEKIVHCRPVGYRKVEVSTKERVELPS